MQNQFELYNKQNNLFLKEQKVLVAFSGGADSVALATLFLKSNISIGLAHCNFKLRGEDSEQDEQFVTSFAKQNNIHLHKIAFDTQAYANKKGISIEMAARELRYNWFAEILKQHQYDLLATGHHLNDSIETFFLNLLRGTGIHGLTGISPKTENLIRPLLFATRKKIEQFLEKEDINYRTDKSNFDDIYKRNAIRSKIIPALKEINPEFESTMKANLEILSQTENIFNHQINNLRSSIVNKDNIHTTLNIKALLNAKSPQTVLFELIKQYGFNATQANDIFQSLEKQSGKKFYSKEYQLIKDREFLIISPVSKHTEASFYITFNETCFNGPIQLRFSKLKFSQETIIKDRNYANFDFDKLSFPLKIRKWKTGDWFQPFGMKGKKKISNFLTDQKASLIEKENTWLLLSNNEVAWVIGKRIDQRFSTDLQTKNLFQIEFTK
jgi:tRNA(Ile)-lysidine synthase